jgi:hypothetical protein
VLSPRDSPRFARPRGPGACPILDGLMFDDAFAGQPLPCSLCGRPLGELPDDQPDWPTGPLCGDCYQAQQAEDEMWEAEAE